MSTMEERISERFPGLVALLHQPEIGGLLTRAVQENWSASQFQAQFTASHWFRSQSESQRKWWVTSATDPGEANQQRRGYRAQVGVAAAKYGIALTGDQINFLSELGLSQGQDPNGPEMLAAFKKLITSKNARAGTRRTAARSVQELARSDFAYGMTTKSAATWGDKIARGIATMDDARQAIAERAAALYPQFASGLKQGHSIADMTDSYKEIIANELELDPQRIDFTSGKWSKVLNWRDKDGTLRAPSASEVQQMAREDPRWWNTANGQQTDYGMANQILDIFGKRKAA